MHGLVFFLSQAADRVSGPWPSSRCTASTARRPSASSSARRRSARRCATPCGRSRVGHAYLFSGPRGTGKTTTARLLAKALNCTGDRAELPPGEPCNSCPSCTEITAGTSMDVVELDAASNRGVGEMRALLERVAYRSAGGARKVYIVDEVHMLTKEASTALLKTLEEPPDHVIFVLATTDPQMVLPTIRSRTQHFEFSLLPADRLAAHLADIAGREGVEADPEALATIARRAGGSARDALSLLDQALAYGEGQLRPEQIAALFGGTATSARAAIVDALAGGDVPGLLEQLDALLGAGVDARTLADDLLRHLREVFLVLSSPGAGAAGDAGGGAGRSWPPRAKRSGAAAVVRALETLGEAADRDPPGARSPPRARGDARPAGPARRGSLEALADRVARLERALDDLRGPPGLRGRRGRRPRHGGRRAGPQPGHLERSAKRRPPAVRRSPGGARGAPQAAPAVRQPPAPADRRPASGSGARTAPAAAPPTEPATGARRRRRGAAHPRRRHRRLGQGAGGVPAPAEGHGQGGPSRSGSRATRSSSGCRPGSRRCTCRRSRARRPRSSPPCPGCSAGGSRLNVVLDDNVVVPAADVPPSGPAPGPDPGGRGRARWRPRWPVRRSRPVGGEG